MQKKLCEISSLKQWKTISSDMLMEDGYPVYGANGIIGYYKEYNHECETLLITCRGATCGALNICQPYSYVNGNAMALDNLSEDVDIKYLYYYLLNRGLSDVITGSAQPQIVRQSLDKVIVKYPALNKQKEIASNLNHIEELISFRTSQLSKLDDLVKSRFIELFGDPVLNPYKWATKPFLETGTCKNGMNFRYDDSGVELNCLGVGDFKDFSIIDDTSVLPMVSLNEMPSSEYLLQDGDIVFVRSNGNKALVGRSVAVYPKNTPTTFSGFCIRYRKSDEAVTIPYLLRVLKSNSIRKQMMGRGANIQNLNQQILSTIVIPIPPIELQNQFATFVEQTDKLKFEVKEALEKLEILKKSLMQQYFG